MSGLRQPGRNAELITLTATALTITPHDAGKIVVCNASGATTITLSDPGTFRPGDQITFLNLANQDLIISCNEKIVTFNNAAADAVSAAQANEKIGAGFIATCIGSLWFVSNLTEETQTTAVTTD